MEGEDQFDYEFSQLSEEPFKMIKKYDEMIYENKITDRKNELLHKIITKLKDQKSSLEKYFQKELFVFEPHSPMELFYPEEKIKHNITEDYIPWYIWREKQVKSNWVLRSKYSWIIWNFDMSKVKYGQKFIRYSQYIMLIYLFRDWFSREHMLTTHFIINCVEMELKYGHSIRDRTLNSKIINLVIKILHFLYERYHLPAFIVLISISSILEVSVL